MRLSALLPQAQGQKEKWPLLNQMKSVFKPLRTSSYLKEMCDSILLGLLLLLEVDKIAKITPREPSLCSKKEQTRRKRRPMMLKCGGPGLIKEVNSYEWRKEPPFCPPPLSHGLPHF